MVPTCWVWRWLQHLNVVLLMTVLHLLLLPLMSRLGPVSFDASTFVTTKDLTMSKYAVRRHTVYNQMSADIKQHGVKLGGVITQGLTQADLFELAPARFKWGKPYIRPKLQHLQVCVPAKQLTVSQSSCA